MTLFERACDGNMLNKVAMTRFLPQLQRLLMSDVEAYSKLLTIYKDSAELLERLDDSAFTELIDIIKVNKRGRVVACMEMMCTSNGTTVHKSQNRWAKVLLQENPQLVWALVLIDGEVLLKDPEGKHQPISITGLHRRIEETKLLSPTAELQDSIHTGVELEASLYRYHIMMLQLIQSLVCVCVCVCVCLCVCVCICVCVCLCVYLNIVV